MRDFAVKQVVAIGPWRLTQNRDAHPRFGVRVTAEGMYPDYVAVCR